MILGPPPGLTEEQMQQNVRDVLGNRKGRRLPVVIVQEEEEEEEES